MIHTWEGGKEENVEWNLYYEHFRCPELKGWPHFRE